MYEFWYDCMKPKHHLFLILVVNMKTKDVYKDIAADVE